MLFLSIVLILAVWACPVAAQLAAAVRPGALTVGVYTRQPDAVNCPGLQASLLDYFNIAARANTLLLPIFCQPAPAARANILMPIFYQHAPGGKSVGAMISPEPNLKAMAEAVSAAVNSLLITGNVPCGSTIIAMAETMSVAVNSLLITGNAMAEALSVAVNSLLITGNVPCGSTIIAMAEAVSVAVNYLLITGNAMAEAVSVAVNSLLITGNVPCGSTIIAMAEAVSVAVNYLLITGNAMAEAVSVAVNYLLITGNAMAEAVSVAVNYLLITGSVPCGSTIVVNPPAVNSSGMFTCLPSVTPSGKFSTPVLRPDPPTPPAPRPAQPYPPQPRHHTTHPIHPRPATGHPDPPATPPPPANNPSPRHLPPDPHAGEATGGGNKPGEPPVIWSLLHVNSTSAELEAQECATVFGMLRSMLNADFQFGSCSTDTGRNSDGTSWNTLSYKLTFSATGGQDLLFERLFTDRRFWKSLASSLNSECGFTGVFLQSTTQIPFAAPARENGWLTVTSSTEPINWAATPLPTQQPGSDFPGVNAQPPVTQGQANVPSILELGLCYEPWEEYPPPVALEQPMQPAVPPSYPPPPPPLVPSYPPEAPSYPPAAPPDVALAALPAGVVVRLRVQVLQSSGYGAGISTCPPALPTAFVNILGSTGLLRGLYPINPSDVDSSFVLCQPVFSSKREVRQYQATAVFDESSGAGALLSILSDPNVAAALAVWASIPCGSSFQVLSSVESSPVSYSCDGQSSSAALGYLCCAPE
eukprot:gene7466-607_t